MRFPQANLHVITPMRPVILVVGTTAVFASILLVTTATLGMSPTRVLHDGDNYGVSMALATVR